jgi:hypothetical protein
MKSKAWFETPFQGDVCQITRVFCYYCIGLLTIPGLGPFIAVDPIMASLAGLGVAGAVGGFTGALIGMGIPEFEAKRYQGRLQEGGILLAVHCDTPDEIKRTKGVLKAPNAKDVSSTGEASVDNKQTGP